MRENKNAAANIGHSILVNDARQIDGSDPMVRPRSRIRLLIPHVLVGTALWIATFSAFQPALENGFVNWDDPANFVNNEFIRGFEVDHLRWMWMQAHQGHYQPITWMTVALDYVISGEVDPRAMHRTSLLIHAANVLLFYALCVALLIRVGGLAPFAVPLGAGLAALLFAVHPMRVESVAWATERRDVVSGFFFLAALLAYLRATSTQTMHGRAWWIASVLLHLCAVLSKVICVTLLGVLVIIDVWPLVRIGGRKRWWGGASTRVWLEKIPFAVVSVIASGGAFLSQGPAMLGLAGLGIGERLANSAIALAFYPFKFVWPVDLIPIYHLHRDASLLDRGVLACALGTLGVTVLLFLVRRRFPALLGVWAAYLVMIAPVLSLTQNGMQMAADRYSYLSVLGFSLLVGGGFVWFAAGGLSRSARIASVLIVAAVVAGVLVPLTRRQTTIWRDSITLWQATLRVDPQSWIANHNLANRYLDLEDFDRAAEHYRRALAVEDRLGILHANAAIAFARQGSRHEAEYHALQAVKLSDGSENSIRSAGSAAMMTESWVAAGEIYRLGVQRHPQNIDMHINLGQVLVKNEDYLGALGAFRRALELNPQRMPLYRYTARALTELNRFTEAKDTLQQALRIRPDWEPAESLLEDNRVRSMQYEAGLRVDVLKARLEEDSGNPDLRRELADAFAKAGRLLKAVSAYEDILEQRPTDHGARLGLARCFESLDRYDKAVAVLRAGLPPQPQEPDSVEIALALSRLFSMAPVPEVRDASQAIQLAEWAVRQSADPEPRTLGALANAHAEAGHFDRAERFCEQAIRKARSRGRKAVASNLEARLELYRAQKAYHKKRDSNAASAGETE